MAKTWGEVKNVAPNRALVSVLKLLVGVTGLKSSKIQSGQQI